MITAILLAAGASRRMGVIDKLTLNYQGKALLVHVIQQLLAADIGELIVVRREGSRDFLPPHLQDRIQIVVNPQAERGMTSSIQVGLSLASPTASGYLIALADMPLLRTLDFNKIIAAFQQRVVEQEATISVPFYRGRKGNPVIFAARYAPALLNNPYPEGARPLIKKNWTQLQRVAMDSPRVLVDVDTAEDAALYL